MMIENDSELRQALDALTTLRLALAALHHRLAHANPSNFSLLAEGPLNEIARIEADVDEYLGLADARAPLWVRVVGHDIHAGNAPTAVMTSILSTFRKGLQAATEHLSSGRLSTRPTAAVQEAVDVRLTALAPGSLRMGLSIEQHGDENKLTRALEQSLQEYFAIVEWAGRNSDDEADADLAVQIPDPSRRRLLLNLVMQLAPRSRGVVDSVEFSGRSVKTARAVQLTRASREHLAAALDRVEKSVIEKHLGPLRELDLDKRTGVVRTEKEEIPCEFAEELMTTAQEALGRVVHAVGSRTEATGRRRTTLFVTRLEILDDVATSPRHLDE